MNGSAAEFLRFDEFALEALREDLVRAQFFVSSVEELLGPVASAALRRTQLLLARDGVQNKLTEPVGALTALFMLGQEITASQLGTALPNLGADGAVALGLVARQGAGSDDLVRARVDLRPYSARDAAGEVDWWIAADLGEEILGHALPGHHVLGVGGAAKTLAGVTVRDERVRALDLGTGSGIQALHLLRHSREVVGTDISRRALDFARFNLALNGVGGAVELREGSLLEPVAGEKFDLVVSNPPFVISPLDSGLPEYEYRAGGLRGDALVGNLVTEIGGYLTPGGVAQFLGNWEHRRGEDWQERLGGWLDRAAGAGTPVDAWIVEREVQDPAQYAETWLLDGGADPRRDRGQYERAYRSWLADFAERDVEAIGFGYILLRRAANDTDPQIRRIEHVGTPVTRPLGGHISAVLAGVDALKNLDEASILATHFVCPADVTEERYGRPGASDPAMIFLRQGGGFGRSVQVSTWQSAFVGACDGELSAAQICAALAHLGEVPVQEVIAEVLRFLEVAIWGGFLQVVSESEVA